MAMQSEEPWQEPWRRTRTIQVKNVLTGSKLRYGDQMYFVCRVCIDYTSDAFVLDLIHENGACTRHRMNGSMFVYLW